MFLMHVFIGLEMDLLACSWHTIGAIDQFQIDDAITLKGAKSENCNSYISLYCDRTVYLENLLSFAVARKFIHLPIHHNASPEIHC